MTSQDGGKTSNEVSGGTFNGPVLQGGSFVGTTFVTQQAAPAPVALAQLPPLTAGFTGRHNELALFTRLLNPAADAEAVVVSAVAGLAGVGKTALAVQAAHAARSSGWFAGGVLFIDLHGYDSSPVQPGQALDALLRALGVPGEHVPEGVEQRAGLYRSALAQIADPVLIVADNASAEAQVRLLMPGPGPHRVIITSRHTLAGLGARLLDVTVLGQAVAVQLLDEAVRAGRPDDERISGDPAAARKLALVCGGLPLALQITAALLVADSALSAAELAAEMADEVRRLAALRYDDGSGVNAPSVAAAFELSYRQLDEEAARLFRLLPANPGPDASTAAAAELAGWPAGRTRAAIGRLVHAHLVEPGGARGRWRMHDLLRLYARQLPGGGAGEREQAVERLLAWYLHRADAANDHMQALAGTSVSVEFPGRDDALAWLDAERPGLIAAVGMAAAAGRHHEAMVLPLILSGYLRWRRRFDDWLSVLSVSRESARQVNHKVAEAAALSDLGLALREVRRFEEAISACQEAAAISQETGNRDLEGMALTNLGGALQEVRRVEEAIACYERDIAIFRETGDRHSEGTALSSLGLALREVRRFEEAISAHHDAVGIYGETGDRYGEGLALEDLAIAYRETGQPVQAATCWREAATAMREAGDRDEAARMEQLGANVQTEQRT